MDRLELPDQHDGRITAVWGELAELRRRIGELSCELTRLQADRRRSTHSSSRRSDGIAGIGATAATLADCGTSLPEQDATKADRGNPRRFHRSAEWKKSMDDFFHGQLATQMAGAVAGASGKRKHARRGSPVTRRRPPVADGRRRFVGPIAASVAVHLAALAVLSAFFIPVESRRTPVTITISAVEAEASLAEVAMAEFDSLVEPTAPVHADDFPDPEPTTPPLEEPASADPQPLVEAADPPLPMPQTPADASLVDAASAGEVNRSAAVPPEAGAPGDGRAVVGNSAGAAGPRTAPRERQAAAFFGRVGQGKSVCFICDNSNSYRDGRFHAVLDELMRAVQGLRAEQSFFVIFTSDAAYPLFHPEPVARLQPATPENKHRLRAWLGTVEMCRGGQGIDDAVRIAASLDADCVYLLSDGELNAGTVNRLRVADFGGAAVHTFGIQGSIIDTRSGQVDHGRFLRQEECNRNLASIAVAHGGTFTPVMVPAAAAVLERLRPIPRNRSRGAVWGLRL